MSHVHPVSNGAVLVRSTDVEALGGAPQMIRLLVDSSSTAGRLSAQRVTLQHGVDGANPHRHNHSAELFYVLGGSAQVLAGDQVLVANEGDLAVIPSGLAHAFAAAPGHDADLLIVITPGVERFEYFRHLVRIARGEQPASSLLQVQERYDTWFERSAAWQQAGRRKGKPTPAKCLPANQRGRSSVLSLRSSVGRARRRSWQVDARLKTEDRRRRTRGIDVAGSI